MSDKIVACYILHYGAEWLYWSLRSVVDWVDEVHLFYSRTPSHGHSTNQICPENRAMLYTACTHFWKDGYKVGFHDVGPFPHEGAHREYAVNWCFNDNRADVVVVVDADEIWHSAELWNNVLALVGEQRAHIYRINMIHFWRSLKYACYDEAMPTRVIRKDYDFPELYIGKDFGQVYHMGYAQTPQIISYKQEIHGHKAEWRPNWFQDIFLPWVPGKGDVHPTNYDYWNPILFKDVDGSLAFHCADHPFWDVDIIS